MLADELIELRQAELMIDRCAGLLALDESGSTEDTIVEPVAREIPAFRERRPYRRHGRSSTAPSGSFTVPPIGKAETNSLSVSAKIWCTWAAGRTSVSPAW